VSLVTFFLEHSVDGNYDIMRQLFPNKYFALVGLLEPHGIRQRFTSCRIVPICQCRFI